MERVVAFEYGEEKRREEKRGVLTTLFQNHFCGNMGGAASITDVPEELKEDYELFFSEGTTQSDLKVMIKICAADYENIKSAQPGLSHGEILQIIKRKLQSQKESYIMEGAPGT